MNRKIVGKVTEEEKREIQRLYERKNGLKELAALLTPENPELYEKLVADIGNTHSRFQSWWNTMSNKYQWESIEGGNWEIDFDTCTIYLTEP